MTIQKKKFKEYFFLVLIFITIMEYQTYVVTSTTADRLIKIIPLIIIFIFYKSHKPTNNMRKIFMLYTIFFLFVFMSCLININERAIVQYLKNIVLFSILVIILFKVRPADFSDKILKVPMLIGVLLSIQVFTVFLLTYFGIAIDHEWVYSARNDREIPYSLLFGDMRFVHTVNTGGFITRAISYFSAPSKFAMFMQYALIMAYGYYKMTKKSRYLLVVFISIISIFISFSFAAILSLIAIIIFSIMFNISRYFSRKYILIIGALSIFIIIISVSLFSQFFQHQHEKYKLTPGTIQEKIFRGGTYKSLIIKEPSQKVEYSLRNVLVHPFGVGLGLYSGEAVSQNALTQWFIIAGVPGIVILLFLYLHLFNNYVFTALNSQKTSVRKYIALVFVVYTLMQLADGTFFYSMYLFVIAMMIILKDYNFGASSKVV